MQTEPPRAAKKYSQTWEFAAGRIQHRVLGWAPDFLKPGDTMSTVPLTASLLSIVPGLGSFFLTQKLRWPLLQFGIWAILSLFYLVSFGTGSGFMVAMILFSFHQYLMYNSYLQGLRLNQLPLPGFWAGSGISLLMVALLGLLYFGAFSLMGERLFCADRDMAGMMESGDHFFLGREDTYVPGQVVLFDQGFSLYEAYTFVRHAQLLERILAKGGDRVDFQDGKVLVNGQPLAAGAGPLENSITLPASGFEVPPDTYFVLFPVRTNRKLDPDWFLVPKANIKGRLAFKYFPEMEALP